MTTFLVACGAAVFVVMLAPLYRTVAGPTLWDRLSGFALVGTKTLILLLFAGQLAGRPEMFADIALAYALIGFLASLVLAKFLEKTSRS